MALTARNLAGLTRSDTKRARSEACRFARSLSEIFPELADLPEEGAEIDAEQGIALVEALRARALNSYSAGDVAAEYCLLVLYVIGRVPQLSRLQRRIITSLGTVVKARPLPTQRLRDFVHSNLEQPDEIRFALSACKRCNSMLFDRLKRAVQEAWEDFELPQDLCILAVGYSESGIRVLKAVAGSSGQQPIVLAPTISLANRQLSEGERLKQALEDQGFLGEVRLVSESEALGRCEAGDVDVILSGCKVIGRAEPQLVEVVNSAACVSLVKQARRAGVPLVVVSGLHKVWPDGYYRPRRELLVTSQTTDHEPVNGILNQDDIDWVLTDRGHVPGKDFAVAKLTQPYFQIQALEYSSALTACDDIEKYKYIEDNIHNIETIMGAISMEGTSELETTLERPLYRGSPEYGKFSKAGKLPEHFLRAEQYFIEKLQDDRWYSQYAGFHVAIINEEVVDSGQDVVALTKRVYAKWGYQPILMPLVTRESYDDIVLPEPWGDILPPSPRT